MTNNNAGNIFPFVPQLFVSYHIILLLYFSCTIYVKIIFVTRSACQNLIHHSEPYSMMKQFMENLERIKKAANNWIQVYKAQNLRQLRYLEGILMIFVSVDR